MYILWTVALGFLLSSFTGLSAAEFIYFESRPGVVQPVFPPAYEGNRGWAFLKCPETSRMQPYRTSHDEEPDYHPALFLEAMNSPERRRAYGRIIEQLEMDSRGMYPTYIVPCQLKRTLLIQGQIHHGDSPRLELVLRRIQQDFEALREGGYFGVVADPVGQAADLPSPSNGLIYFAKPFALEVQINSPGGDYREGIKIAKRLQKFAKENELLLITNVVGLGAWSAGAMIWSVGDFKLLSAGTTLALHAAYFHQTQKISDAALKETIEFVRENYAGFSSLHGELKDFGETVIEYLPSLFAREGPRGFIRLSDQRIPGVDAPGVALHIDNAAKRYRGEMDWFRWLYQELFVDWGFMFSEIQSGLGGGMNVVSYSTPIARNPISFTTTKGLSRLVQILRSSSFHQPYIELAADKLGIFSRADLGELVIGHLRYSRRTHFELWNFNEKEFVPPFSEYFDFLENPPALVDSASESIYGEQYYHFRTFISQFTLQPNFYVSFPMTELERRLNR